MVNLYNWGEQTKDDNCFRKSYGLLVGREIG